MENASVLRMLYDELDGRPVGVLLTGTRGLRVYPLADDRDLERDLDRDLERDLNSILFAPAGVIGHERYAERLAGMPGAGVPVLDPVTGETVGVVDPARWRGRGGPLMLPPTRAPLARAPLTRATLARSAVPDVSQPPAASSDRGLRLLQAYTQACRQRGGIVLGLGEDIVMLNDHARQALSPADQAVLISCAAEMLERRSPGAVPVELPSGAVARMSCQPVAAADGSGTAPRGWPWRLGWTSRSSRAGAREQGSHGHEPHGPQRPEGQGLGPAADGVVLVKLVAPGSAAAAAALPPPRPPVALPGLVGSGAVWWRACRQAETAYQCGEWLALEGESGVGKLALIRAVHRRHHPAAPLHVLDAADGGDDLLARARGELADGSGMLVLRHVHALDAAQALALAGALREAKAAGRDAALRVAVTVADVTDADTTDANVTDAEAPNGRGDLLRLFPAVVAVPPLRHHSEDLGELVPFFLGRLRKQGQVTCSPAATQLLARYAWPGNAAQLWQVLKQAVQRRRAGQIMPDDLPSEVWTVSRRMLSPLESMERDAIVRSLFDHGGSKIRAARALGMSRATMYRRIREYGIMT